MTKPIVQTAKSFMSIVKENTYRKEKGDKMKVPRRIKIDTLVISKHNIDDFVIANPRRLRPDAIKGIADYILSGDTNFEEPMHIAYEGDHIGVINGHHRIEGIKKALKKNPKLKVVEDAYVYDTKILDDPQMMTVLYDSISRGTTESSEDYLAKHRITGIPSMERLLIELPATLDRTEDGILLKWLIDAHWMSKRKIFPGSAHLKAHQYPKEVKQLNKKELNEIIKITNVMIDIYGNGSSEDYLKFAPFKRTSSFYAVYNIIARNKTRLPMVYIKKRMKKILTKDYLKEHSSSGSSDCKKMFDDYVNRLNKAKHNRAELFCGELTRGKK